ncbi:transcription antitermination factor NusB [Bacteroidota bacterium]|nr:transcription antitermination factor NusB [Bacteroidota bacterium]MDC3230110.1 transcription antitermination factor NusB [Bacteroidota bacterium]
MLNRRQIRLKVMQSLYSYYSLSNLKVKEKNNHLFEVSHLTNLFYLFIKILVRTSNFSKEFHISNKKKFFPTEKDLNPNYNFFENKFLKIFKNDNFFKYFKDINEISEKLNINHDLDRKFFIEIYKSELYANYTKSNKTSYKTDANFVLQVLKNIFPQYAFFKELLFEENVYWIDDYEAVLIFLINKIKNNEKVESFKISTPFKNSDDKSFFTFLYEKTIEKNKDFDKIIEKNSANWDLERIATIDMILLKMGLTEFFYIKDLPYKVTLNEYIEISKSYSTRKSSKFINGVLDNILLSSEEIRKK